MQKEEKEKPATTASKATRSLLESLEKAINTGLELVESCGKRSSLNLFFHGQGLAGKLEDVHEDISCCVRTLKLANLLVLSRIVKQLLEGIHRELRSNSADAKALTRSLSNPSIPNTWSEDKKEVFMWVVSHSDKDYVTEQKGQIVRTHHINVTQTALGAGNKGNIIGPADGKGSELNITTQGTEEKSYTKEAEELRTLAEEVVSKVHENRWLPVKRSAKQILDFMQYLDDLGMKAQDVTSPGQLSRIKRVLRNAYDDFTRYSHGGGGGGGGATNFQYFLRSTKRIDEQIRSAQNDINLYLEQLPTVRVLRNQISHLLSHDKKMMQELSEIYRRTT
ncbi:hypothetical protein GUJ93_ZPchr0009g2293 [Zizania palustris]|uniref:Uncharacterized protein n=1 Tax=Zizania palustris TaxID=103762 RepID=A0A8J5RYE0_ZIZPA|nr:hypothetical protein GUJ93_ZPchr0009g2293 [Zizania palustris]